MLKSNHSLHYKTLNPFSRYNSNIPLSIQNCSRVFTFLIDMVLLKEIVTRRWYTWICAGFKKRKRKLLHSVYAHIWKTVCVCIVNMFTCMHTILHSYFYNSLQSLKSLIELMWAHPHENENKCYFHFLRLCELKQKIQISKMMSIIQPVVVLELFFFSW